MKVKSANVFKKGEYKMKKNFLLALAAVAAISFTGCGRETVGPATPSDVRPTSNSAVTTSAYDTAETTASTTAVTTANTTTDINAETSAQNSAETTAASAQNNSTSQSEAPQQQNAVPAGGGDQTSDQSETQQSAALSSTNAPSPSDYNYGPAPTQYNIDGLTYINGVLIANKSYSLPADFNPGLDATCQNQFYKLQSDAAQQGLNIWLSSGFRSYDYQSQIYNNYVARDGQAAADTYSARPGHSEHQSGLAIDVNQIDDSFIGTPEAIWLENHCHEYGFILRYPQGKQDITGYKYESWHIRYVGTDMSYPIHASGLTLEEYFGIDSYYHS